MILPINQIICGDCLDVMRGWPDGCVDLVLTDPPWNLDYFIDDKKDWTEYAAWLSKHIKECERLSSGVVIMFQSTKAISHTSHLFKGWIPFASVKNFSQMTPKALPNCWDIAFISGNKAYQGNGRNWFLCNTAGMLQNRTEHPTPRTIDVCKYLLSLYAGSSVLDPFCGSGTTCVAAKMLGRDYIGIDISEDYCQIARERLAACETGVPVKEARAGQGSLFE